MTLSTLSIDSPLGTLRLYGDNDELVAVHLPTSGEPTRAAAQRATDVLATVADQLREYFAGTRRTFELPLAGRGTGFQQRVWRALTTIPYGETWSYGALARAIGRPSASRAVGAANGKNPIAIVVPCHRVIGANGTLTGYAGGIETKRWLLEHELRHGGMRAVGSLFATC